MKKFWSSISSCSYKSASIKNNSTAQIVHLTISNSEYGDDVPYEMALEYEQLDDLINLCHLIMKEENGNN